MRLLFFLINLLIASIIFAQNPVGIFSNHSDIGKPKMSGSTVYNSDGPEL